MEKCPCEECISLAICVSKKQIYCDTLEKFFNDAYGEENIITSQDGRDAHDSFWLKMNKILPNLNMVFTETGKNGW